MGEAFHQGGWGMYPTTIAGLVLVYTAIRYALAPDPNRAAVIRRLSLLTFIVGCLGFTVGLIKTCLGAGEMAPPDLGATIVQGFGESLNNVALALCMLVLAGIFATVGTARRAPSKGGDELIAP